MLKPVGEAGAEKVPDLVENITSEGCIPTDWQESFIVNLYKGKVDALNRGNYRGLKLIEQVMKVLERVVEGFMSGRGTTDAIFIVHQLQDADSEFKCARCLGTARAIDERQSLEVEVWNEKLEVVPNFCYLGDLLSAGGGCKLAANTRCKSAWCKFRQLLPLLTHCQVPLLTRRKVYSSCVRSVMLHAAETLAIKGYTDRLRRNDRAMIHWICNVKTKDEVSSDSLLTKLGLKDLDMVLRTNRMRWFGHVERNTG